MQKRNIFLVVAILLVHNLLAQVSLTKKMDVLNGRAMFNFPYSAYVMQRSTGVLGAEPNPNEETRILYDTGKMRLVIFAQELYQYGDDNLLNDVNRDSSYSKNFKSGNFISIDTLHAILSTPIKYDTSQRAILLYSLLVETKDGMLFRTDAYINKDAYTQKDFFEKMALSIFHTLTNGTRSIARNRRVEEYHLPDSTKTLRFMVPADYCITIDKQYDQEVFRIHKFTDFGSTIRANIMIYVGGQQNYVYENYGEYRQDAHIDSSGFFLGQPTKWMTFLDPMHNIFLQEQGIPYTNDALGTSIHVAMLSNRQEMLFELSQVVSSIELRTE